MLKGLKPEMKDYDTDEKLYIFFKKEEKYSISRVLKQTKMS